MELNVERKIIRQYLTKTLNDLNANTCKPNFDKLKMKCERLKDINSEIRKIMKSKETSEEDWTKELTGVTDYEDKIFDIFQQLTVEKENDGTDSIIDGVGDEERRANTNLKLNLPVFTISKFNGDLKQWNLFWNQFKKIDSNELLDNDVKFSYLLQNLEGPPRKLLESYQVVGNNYEKALFELKSRFAREDLLIDIYIRELMTTMINQLKTSKLTISDLYDNLMSNINNLEALNIEMENYSLILVPIIEACLPIETLKLWERIKNENKSKSSSNLSINVSGTKLEELLSFMKNEVETEQKLAYVSSAGATGFTAASLV